MAYDISCKMIRNDQICDYGWHVGDEIYFSASDGRLSLPGGHGCLWALHDLVEMILELSHYIPSWAKRDENGEPYLTYRCNSIAPVWWEVRRVGEDKKLGPAGTPEEFEKKKEMLKEIQEREGFIVDNKKFELYRY